MLFVNAALNVRVKCTRTRRIFEVNFLEIEASNEKNLFYTFDLPFHVKLTPPRLYHQY